MAGWLLQPASAQEDGEAIPDEVQIIEELPELMERRDELLMNDQLREAERREERIEEQREAVDRERGTAFEQDRSLLTGPPGESPAERLLPDEEDVPELELDPRSPDRDEIPDGAEIEDTVTGGDPVPETGTETQDAVPEPPDATAPAMGDPTARGTGGGGSGSLF